MFGKRRSVAPNCEKVWTRHLDRWGRRNCCELLLCFGLMHLLSSTCAKTVLTFYGNYVRTMDASVVEKETWKIWALSIASQFQNRVIRSGDINSKAEMLCRTSIET